MPAWEARETVLYEFTKKRYGNSKSRIYPCANTPPHKKYLSDTAVCGALHPLGLLSVHHSKRPVPVPFHPML